MKRLFCSTALAAAMLTFPALADDDDLPADVKAKVEAALKDIGCEGYEEAEQEAEGGIEIEDANCKMGRMDVKFDKNLAVVLISRY